MWTYIQSTGEMVSADGEVIATGYAGRRGEARNNPAMENVKDTGPLPAGTYQIGSAMLMPKLGPVSMPLARVSGESFGRSGFFIHGDNAAGDASEGCIVLPRPAREAIARSADKRLKVVARG